MSVLEELDKLKRVIPPVNGNVEKVEEIKTFTRDTLNVLRILMTEYAGYPVMEDVTEEIRRYKERWG